MPGPADGRLVVITGASAAGKTTLGRAVAALLPRAIHIDGDAIQRWVAAGSVLMDNPPPPGAVEQLWLRYEAALAVARIYRRAGFDAIVSDNIFDDGLVAFLRLAFADGSTPQAAVVVLDPPLEVIVQRYAGRPGGGYGASLTPAHLRAAIARTPRLGLWLDTSGQSPERSAAEVVARLEEATVTEGRLAAIAGTAGTGRPSSSAE